MNEFLNKMAALAISRALLLFALAAFMQTAHAAQTGIVFEGPVYSQAFGADRFVRICLPESYHSQPKRRYPVLYVHDGQNAFTSAGPHAAFGWGNWQLDKTARDLAQQGRMQEIIIVAVDCSRERYREYRGPNTNGLPTLNDPSAKYARFLIDELKPKIDHDYRTKSEAKHTGILGSSMGGICSLWLGWQHPRTFGKVASISGAFQVERQFFLRKILSEYDGRRKPLQIYLDSGITDYSGGDDGAALTKAVAEQLRRIGYKDGRDLMHFVDQPLTAEELKPFNLPADKFAEAQRSQHNEMYWRLRAWRALTYLYPPNGKNLTGEN